MYIYVDITSLGWQLNKSYYNSSFLLVIHSDAATCSTVTQCPSNTKPLLIHRIESKYYLNNTNNTFSCNF